MMRFYERLRAFHLAMLTVLFLCVSVMLVCEGCGGAFGPSHATLGTEPSLRQSGMVGQQDPAPHRRSSDVVRLLQHRQVGHRQDLQGIRFHLQGGRCYRMLLGEFLSVSLDYHIEV